MSIRVLDIENLEVRRRIMEAISGHGDIPSGPFKPSNDPESELHDYIIQFCRERGWMPIYSRMDKRSTVAAGVSDFIIVATERVYFVEAKRRGNKPSPKQRAFLHAVCALGWPTAVVYSAPEFDAFINQHHTTQTKTP